MQGEVVGDKKKGWKQWGLCSMWLWEADSIMMLPRSPVPWPGGRVSSRITDLRIPWGPQDPWKYSSFGDGAGFWPQEGRSR